MKQILFTLVIFVGVSYAMGMWERENDFDYEAPSESFRQDGCLTEEQECTHSKDACCSTGDMSDSACNCYQKTYFDGKDRPDVTKCWCEHTGVWWNFAYNDMS